MVYTLRIIAISYGFIVRGQDHFFHVLRARCDCAFEGLDMTAVARKFLTKLPFKRNVPGYRCGIASRWCYRATVRAGSLFDIEGRQHGAYREPYGGNGMVLTRTVRGISRM